MVQAERIAVVGGGIFGATTAVELARTGYSVVLFEQSHTLLSAASSANQRRLHRGYHYPRGMDTVAAVMRAFGAFKTEYGAAIHNRSAHYVAIAKRNSLVTAERYLAFCDRVGLPYREEYPPFLRRRSVELSVRIAEAHIDINELRRLCSARLAAAGVEVRLRTRADRRTLREFDQVVLATYSSINALHPGPVSALPEYQFEVCEKPLVALPPMYLGHSLVIMDGPFMCLDQVAGTRRFLLGNVDHAIHATTVGPYPLIPGPLMQYVNAGLVRRPQVTRFPDFQRFARRYVTGFAEAGHLGSYFTVRAVLPHVETTDDRPTLVRRLDDRTVALFGGKIATCVASARQVAGLLREGGWQPLAVSGES
ncbi:FAD-dependent oxidoreductase [Streptomyces sp. WZ-12]|uniref:FAD-dependent oxidoreductase n=1 Tax=Streptomyces sp. WZ-12 TaxID=3030210 RepID=UPI0023816E6D|nr:FAD-dependent oxidoreductase [Streptomyces sp. WZ-12]